MSYIRLMESQATPYIFPTVNHHGSGYWSHDLERGKRVPSRLGSSNKWGHAVEILIRSDGRLTYKSLPRFSIVFSKF